MDRNPVLNSPNDITDELIQRIINNDLDSLTLNYEFSADYEDSSVQNSDQNSDEEKFEEKQRQKNPFFRANRDTPIKRIEFEIKLGSEVSSLAFAFYGLQHLEYVNLKDTSRVTNMKSLLRI
jgi:hypothetical protein